MEMRQISRGARFRVLRALGRRAARYRKRFAATSADRAANEARAQRLAEEAAMIREWDVDRLSKALLAQEGTLSEAGAISTTGQAGRKELALARLAQVPSVRKRINEFRSQHADWRELVYFMLYKNTGGKFRKRDKKQVKKGTPRCMADDLKAARAFAPASTTSKEVGERDSCASIPADSRESESVSYTRSPSSCIPQRDCVSASETVAKPTSSNLMTGDPAVSIDGLADKPVTENSNNTNNEEDAFNSEESDDDDDFLMMDVSFNSPSSFISFGDKSLRFSAPDVDDKSCSNVRKLSRKTREVWNLWNISAEENDDSDREYGKRRKSAGGKGDGKGQASSARGRVHHEKNSIGRQRSSLQDDSYTRRRSSYGKDGKHHEGKSSWSANNTQMQHRLRANVCKNDNSSHSTLHPSWEAKLKMNKTMKGVIAAGKRTTFDDD